jgi:hypothetical protein
MPTTTSVALAAALAKRAAAVLPLTILTLVLTLVVLVALLRRPEARRDRMVRFLLRELTRFGAMLQDRTLD